MVSDKEYWKGFLPEITIKSAGKGSWTYSFSQQTEDLFFDYPLPELGTRCGLRALRVFSPYTVRQKNCPYFVAMNCRQKRRNPFSANFLLTFRGTLTPNMSCSKIPSRMCGSPCRCDLMLVTSIFFPSSFRYDLLTFRSGDSFPVHSVNVCLSPPAHFLLRKNSRPATEIPLKSCSLFRVANPLKDPKQLACRRRTCS